MSIRLTPEDYLNQNRRAFMEEALTLTPIVDKDRAEDELAMLQQISGKRNEALEEEVRDGEPIRTHIAIAHVREELQRLIGNSSQSRQDNGGTLMRTVRPDAIDQRTLPTTVVVYDAVVNPNR